MSVAVDTNVVLRYLQGDGGQQAALAVRLIDEKCNPARPALVSSVTLAEVFWVLASKYRVPRAAAVNTIRRLLQNPHLLAIDAAAVETALDACEGAAGDFADHLVGALMREAGAAPTFTFDRKAARHPDLTLLTHESLDALG